MRPQPSVTVIAEIGVNHNGSLERALALVDMAAQAGADVAKFQTFSARALASEDTPKVAYQERDTSTVSHQEMLARLELSESDHVTLVRHCDDRGIEFMSTPYGVPEAEFLLSLGVRRFKTASADIVDLPLQEFLASTGRPVLASTGMSSREEVAALVELYRDAPAALTLLHTTSEYPTPVGHTNLRRLVALADFGCPVGYSDHTEGSMTATMAVALGAEVIERHVTLDRSDVGPDHFASDAPEEFGAYVAAVREAALRLGTPDFTPTEAEASMARTSRKSLHLLHDRPEGWPVTEADLVLRRPGTGVLWSQRDTVIGRSLRRDLPAGSLLRPEDVRP